MAKGLLDEENSVIGHKVAATVIDPKHVVVLFVVEAVGSVDDASPIEIVVRGDRDAHGTRKEERLRDTVRFAMF